MVKKNLKINRFYFAKNKKNVVIEKLDFIHGPYDHNSRVVFNSAQTWARSPGLGRSVIVCVVNAVLTLRVLALCLGFTMKPNAKLAGTGGRYNHVNLGSPRPHGHSVYF